MKKNVLTIFGTRPEAIKMAPVIKELGQFSAQIQTIVALTAQHREMLDQVVKTFNIKCDYDLNIMSKNQSLSTITCNVLKKLDKILDKEKIDFILVQGDTTTAFASSLIGFYHKIPVGHIEAGLRTYDKNNPFPEEMNRLLTSKLADIHFAPTKLAMDNLLKEGINDKSILITGNTVIDALMMIVKKKGYKTQNLDNLPKKILVTAHRRESWGRPLEEICEAIIDITNKHEEICVIFPVHFNPNVRNTVYKYLKGIRSVKLIEPVEYINFIKLMAESYLILSDSGGIQEEAPSLGKPVLVLRKETERKEGIEAGTSKLVGTNKNIISEEVSYLINNQDAYIKVAKKENPYGDGKASKRIVEYLAKYLAN